MVPPGTNERGETMTDTTTWWKLEKSARAEVRERAAALAAEPYPEDTLTEMADAWVPIYTSDLMDLAADNIDFAVLEPEIGPAFDGTPTPVNIVAANIYEALSEAIGDEWRMVQAEMEDSEEATS
jgi:hypothetical protein